MLEINQGELGKILHLFPGRDHNMSLQAAAEGKAKAKAWVDSKECPRAAAACFGYRLIVCGNPEDDDSRNAITGFLRDVVLENRIESLQHFAMLFWDEPGWQDVLEGALAAYKTFTADREYYRLDTLQGIQEALLPEGFEFRKVDKAFLDEKEWINKRELMDEMCSERADVADFLANSFGFCAVEGNTIAGWCLSEYNNSSGCEVGIEVRDDFRRRGIAASLVRALSAEAERRSLRYVGWSCFKNNAPSSATARRAGFEKVMDYKCILLEK